MAAVYGFFGISGFLIAGSASRNGFGRYLWQRFLRIFPGYWVCIVATAFVFGLIAWSSASHPFAPHCGLRCYLNHGDGPASYVYRNFLLVVNQYRISNTPLGVPDPGECNGSVWTLFFEFLCYLMVGGLALIGFLRRRYGVALAALALWLIAAVLTARPHLLGSFGTFNLSRLYDPTINPRLDFGFVTMKLLTFGSIFLVGATLYVYRGKLPDSGLVALGCTVAAVASLWFPFGGKLPAVTLTSTDLLAPLLAYPLIWLGIHLPFQRVGARNDYSYGVYIYAFPVQQLLATWNFQRWGYPAYLLLSIAAVIPFAVASWWIVEKQALKLKRFDFAATRSAPQAHLN